MFEGGRKMNVDPLSTMNPAKGMGGNIMKTIVRSLMVLGLISVLLMGVAWAGGSETKWMTPAGEELKGTEFPFPVGWVPGVEADDSYVGREAMETGALPETLKPVDELKGTEFPFPVGWVPDEKE
jgi:hypothetical protein